MPARPIAGHPTLVDACASLAREGMTSREIGAQLGIPTCNASSATAYRLGKGGIIRPPATSTTRRLQRPGEVLRRTVPIDLDVLDALAPLAARHGLSTPKLVRALLGVLADEPTLVANLLDEMADPTTPARQVPA